MTCESAQALLSAFLDRELDLAKSLELEEHTRACNRCAAALRQDEALRASLRAAALARTAPPGLERRIRKGLSREAGIKGPPVLRRWRWAAVPAAATLAAVLAWGVTIHRGGTSADHLMTAELVSGHVRSLMADHLVDVATSDQHVVKPWFNGKVDFAPPVADFTASGFPLAGGRLDYIAGRPVAVVIYRRRQHVVNVFISPAPGAAPRDPRRRESEGYHLLEWRQSGLAFWAVSDVSHADLESLARLIQDAG